MGPTISASGEGARAGLRRPLRFIAGCLLCVACETSGPPVTDAGSDGSAQDALTADVLTTDVVTADVVTADASVPRCQPLATDYIPRSRMPAMTQWPMCASDNGMYAPNDMSISTIGRVRAFDQMHRDPMTMRADGFFDPTRDPSPAEFTAARLIYAQDNGLGSRVERRSDEHYPAPMVNDCQMEAVRNANLDYCAGPMRLLPIINAGFAAGQTAMTGSATRVHAARIEAALLWFLYLSPYKESLTCSTTARDCDSAWAYYTGGQYDPRATEQYGLARYVLALEPATHTRVWDALLALRCWQQAMPMDVPLRERARAQLDRAMNRAVAVVLIDRARRVASTTGSERDAHFALVKTLGPFMDRAARVVSASSADALATAFRGEDPAAFPAAMVASTLDTLFPCP